MNREERDPGGGQIPLAAPPSNSTYASLHFGQPLFIDGGDPADYSSGYMIDGLPGMAADVARGSASGSISHAPASNVTTIAFQNSKTGEIRSAFGIWSQTQFGNGYLPVGAEFAMSEGGSLKSLFLVRLGNGIGYGEGPYNPFSGSSLSMPYSLGHGQTPQEK